MNATPVPLVVAEVAEHHRADVHRGAQVLAGSARGAGTAGPGRCSRSRTPRGPPGPAARAGAAGTRWPVCSRMSVLERRRPAPRGRPRPARRRSVTPLRRLRLVQRVGEDLAVDVEHRLAEHLQQPPVGVPGEPLVAADLGQALDAGVVQPDVEHRLHHPGHREHRPGTDAHQQRVVPVAQPPAEVVLQLTQRHRHLHPQLARFLPGSRYARHASVVIVKPGGTGSPSLVISARFAPLPPSSSFWSLSPSAKAYTYWVIAGVLSEGRPTLAARPQQTPACLPCRARSTRPPAAASTQEGANGVRAVRPSSTPSRERRLEPHRCRGRRTACLNEGNRGRRHRQLADAEPDQQTSPLVRQRRARRRRPPLRAFRPRCRERSGRVEERLGRRGHRARPPRGSPARRPARTASGRWCRSRGNRRTARTRPSSGPSPAPRP